MPRLRRLSELSDKRMIEDLMILEDMNQLNSEKEEYVEVYEQVRDSISESSLEEPPTRSNSGCLKRSKPGKFTLDPNGLGKRPLGMSPSHFCKINMNGSNSDYRSEMDSDFGCS